MAVKLKIKKGDKVVVITGARETEGGDKGKVGEVLQVLPKEQRVVVQGVNVVKRHTRPTMASAGGIEEKEAPLHVSNVAHVDPKTNLPTRIGYKIVDGRKVRYAKRSGELIDR